MPVGMVAENRAEIYCCRPNAPHQLSFEVSRKDVLGGLAMVVVQAGFDALANMQRHGWSRKPLCWAGRCDWWGVVHHTSSIPHPPGVHHQLRPLACLVALSKTPPLLPHESSNTLSRLALSVVALPVSDTPGTRPACNPVMNATICPKIWTRQCSSLTVSRTIAASVNGRTKQSSRGTTPSILCPAVPGSTPKQDYFLDSSIFMQIL